MKICETAVDIVEVYCKYGNSYGYVAKLRVATSENKRDSSESEASPAQTKPVWTNVRGLGRNLQKKSFLTTPFRPLEIMESLSLYYFDLVLNSWESNYLKHPSSYKSDHYHANENRSRQVHHSYLLARKRHDLKLKFKAFVEIVYLETCYD